MQVKYTSMDSFRFERKFKLTQALEVRIHNLKS